MSLDVGQKLPDITNLKDLANHFYSKFDHFLGSNPESRAIVQIEVVGFQRFLKSTGYFKFFDQNGEDVFGIFLNSVVVRNGELLKAEKLKYDALKKCFSGLDNSAVYAWIGEFGPCCVRNIKKSAFDVTCQAACIWISDTGNQPSLEDFTSVNMDQTKISEQISTLLKEGDEFLQSFQSVCSLKEANVFKIVEVPVQVFSSWGSQFGIFYLPYHTDCNQWGVFLLSDVFINGVPIDEKLLGEEAGRRSYFAAERCKIFHATIRPIKPAHLSTGFFNTLHWHATSLWIWSKEHPSYIPFLEEHLGPIQTEDIHDSEEKEEDMTDQEALISSEQIVLADKIAALKSPSSSPDYFNYFMSQFVRSRECQTSMKRVIKVEFFGKRVFKQNMGIFSFTEEDGTTHWGLFPNTVIYQDGKLEDHKKLVFAKLTRFMKEHINKKVTVYAQIGPYGPSSMQSDDLKYHLITCQAYLIWVSSKGDPPRPELLSISKADSRSSKFQENFRPVPQQPRNPPLVQNDPVIKTPKNAMSVIAKENLLLQTSGTQQQEQNQQQQHSVEYNLQPIANHPIYGNSLSLDYFICPSKTTPVVPDLSVIKNAEHSTSQISEEELLKLLRTIVTQKQHQSSQPVKMIIIQMWEMHLWGEEFGYFKMIVPKDRKSDEVGIYPLQNTYLNGVKLDPRTFQSFEMKTAIYGPPSIKVIHAYVSPFGPVTYKNKLIKWKASAVYIWGKILPDYKTFLREKLDVKSLNQDDRWALWESLSPKYARNVDTDGVSLELLSQKLEEFFGRSTTSRTTPAYKFVPIPKAPFRILKVEFTQRYVDNSEFGVFFFQEKTTLNYLYGVFKSGRFEGKTLRALALRQNLHRDTFALDFVFYAKLVPINPIAVDFRAARCSDKSSLNISFIAEDVFIFRKGEVVSQEILERLAEQSSSELQSSTTPASVKSSTPKKQRISLFPGSNISEHVNLLNQDADSVFEDFRLNKIQNLIKLAKVFEEPTDTEVELVSFQEITDKADQNSGKASTTAAATTAATTTPVTTSVAKPPPVDFAKMFWHQFEAFKNSNEIEKKIVPVQVVDVKDDFGIFKFEQNGIDFFGIFPRDVIYMNNNQVHPDNFVGEKIKTFLIELSLDKRLFARVGKFGPRTTNTQNHPVLCLSYQSDQINIEEKPPRDESNYNVKATVVVSLDSIGLLEEDTSEDKILLRRSSLFVDKIPANDCSMIYRPLHQIFANHNTVFCNKVAKPDWMEMNSICCDEHFLIKQATHLAIVAWVGSKPADSVLESFQAQQVKNLVEEKVTNDFERKASEEVSDEDLVEDSEVVNLANILTDRILGADSLDTNLEQFFTSNSELEVAVHLSKLLVSAIRDFTVKLPTEETTSDLSRSSPAYSDAEDRRSQSTGQYRVGRDVRPSESKPKKSKKKRSRKSDSGSRERTKSPEFHGKHSESSRPVKHEPSVSPEKSKHGKADRSSSPENMEATYQKYLKSLGQEVTSGERKIASCSDSYLKDFQEMEQLLASKNSGSKTECKKVKKNPEKSGKRRRRRHSSSSSEKSRKRDKSGPRSKVRKKSEEHEVLPSQVTEYEPPGAAAKVTEKDIYLHLQKSQAVIEAPKIPEQDIYHHLRNKATTGPTQPTIPGTWIPLSHFPGLLSSFYMSIQSASYNSKYNFYHDEKGMPQNLNEKTAVAIVRENYNNPRTTSTSIFSTKTDLLEKIVTDKNNKLESLSKEVDRDCFKINDENWNKMFHHFQIDLNKSVKLDARPDAITKSHTPILIQHKFSKMNEARCQALIQAWQVDYCYLVNAPIMSTIRKREKEWTKYLKESQHNLALNGIF